jgi:hypothetical protein
MRRRASFPAKRRLGLNEDATSLRARLARSLWPPDGSLRGTPVDFSATTRFVASALALSLRRAASDPSTLALSFFFLLGPKGVVVILAFCLALYIGP